MSSVTMSMVVPVGSSDGRPRPACTRTSARPCGRCAANAACPMATAATRLGSRLGEVLDGHVPVIGVQEAGHVTDASVGACQPGGLGQQGSLLPPEMSVISVNPFPVRAAPLRPLEPISQVPEQRVIPQRHPLVKVGSAGRAAGS